jgi:hypothetical protein
VFFIFKNLRRNFIMAYPIVNLDKLQAKKNGNLESLKHTADVPNGYVAHVGTLVEGTRDVFNVVVPTTASIANTEVVLIASPEVQYLPGKSLEDFVNLTGNIMRGYHLHAGDMFTVSDDAIDGATVVGQYVIPQNASMKLAAAADLTGGTKFAAKVIQKTTIGFGGAKPATVVQVVKA